MSFTRRSILGLGGALALAGCASTYKPFMPSDEVLTRIYLVRHAEKLGGPDPALTEAGTARANELASMLQSAALQHIHSTDYARTRDTATPIAAATGLGIEIYDPRDLEGLAAEILLATGTHLVVGHSNTTPQLVGILGGDGGSEINEASEYDRLYVVDIDRYGAVKSTLLRYGAPYTP